MELTRMTHMTSKSMDLENLFLGNTLENISCEGSVQLKNGEKVRVKNLVSGEIPYGQAVIVVQCKQSKKFYLYATDTK